MKPFSAAQNIPFDMIIGLQMTLMHIDYGWAMNISSQYIAIWQNMGSNVFKLLSPV